MSLPNGTTLARLTRAATLSLMVVCIVHLAFSWAGAKLQAPRDEARILELQELTQQDNSHSPVLAELHDQITKTRLARKDAVNVISIILVIASGLFLTAAKWLIAQQPKAAYVPPELVQVELPEHAPPEPATPKEAAALEIDVTFVDDVIAREGKNPEAAIPILQAIQTHYRYLPDEALQRVCQLTEITPAQIAGTSSFYSQFRRSPVGEHVVRVCHGTACHVSGARQITDELRRSLNIPEGQDTDADRMFTIDEVACLGCCSLAPVLMVDEHTAGKLTPARACEALDAVEKKEPA
jgi:NADH:ubiquinone oxidoreductase subunit E